MDSKSILERLAATAARSLPAEGAAVLLPATAEGCPVVGAVYGVAADDVKVLADWANLGLQPFVVEESSASALPPGFVTAMAALLGSASCPLGALQVYGAPPRQFGPLDAERLQALAELGTVALELARRTAEMEQLEATKSQFIHVATHELRSPVAVAQSLVRMVLKGYAGPLSDQHREIFGRIAGRLDFLENLVNDLLALAATRSPALAEETGPVAVNASLGRVALLLMPQAEEKGITLTHIACCEEMVVRATEDGLDRIFVNLVNNAIKYTPSGGRVTISLRPLDDHVQVQIADTGIGIPAEALPHLFQEFYRAPNARSSGIVGTGLGLVTVKELVEQYGGRIEVESTEGVGTVFTVTFPRTQILN